MKNKRFLMAMMAAALLSGCIQVTYTTPETTGATAAAESAAKSEAGEKGKQETAADGRSQAASAGGNGSQAAVGNVGQAGSAGTAGAAEQGGTETSGTGTAVTPVTELHSYEEVLALYRTAFREKWEMEEYLEADLSLVCRDSTDPMKELGYAYHDFDGDGERELAIGYMDQGDQTLVDLYSLKGGSIEHLCSSTVRSTYYVVALTEHGDYGLGYMGYGGAEAFEYQALSYYDGALHCTQGIRYDAQGEHEWMMGYEQDGVVIYEEAIDEELGSSIIDADMSHVVSLDYVSFA